MHYTIYPLTRINLADIKDLIAKRRYFMLHAPRQTGKTTSLLALMHHLSTSGEYRACYANIEAADLAGNRVAKRLRAVFTAITSAALTITALAGLLLPFVQRCFGVKLSSDDIAALVAVALGLSHAAVAAFNSWRAPLFDRWVAARPTQS